MIEISQEFNFVDPIKKFSGLKI